MKKIMIVEDDKLIRDELINLLNNSNYNTSYVHDFADSFNEIVSSSSDLILLDINIPYENGEELLKKIRKKTNTPIIMVTSKNNEVDEILSYSYGADDYITKPYNPTILLFKISSIFKRCDNNNMIINYKGFTFDISKGVIKTSKEEILLTKNEIIILSLLLNNKDRIVTKDEIMTYLWNNEEYVNENALTVNISRLRTKLASIGYPDIIETRKKIGYRIV